MKFYLIVLISTLMHTDSALALGGSFQCIKGSLFGTESAGSGAYTAVGPQTKYGRPYGKYQFIPSNIQKYTGLSPSAFMANPAIQEQAMDQMLADNWAYAQRQGWDQYIGTKTFTYRSRTSRGFNGPLQSTTLTREGLLAAMHLGSPRAVGAFLRGTGNAADNLGTSVGSYAGHHGANCGGRSSDPVDELGGKSEADFAETMNWDDCFKWEPPAIKVVGMCGRRRSRAPIIAVTFEYTEPPVLIEVVTESGKSAIQGISGVGSALATLGIKSDRAGPNFGANVAGSGHIPRAFFESHVWGVSPRGRFESSGEDLDVKKSLACDLADEMDKWEAAYTPEVKLQQLQQPEVEQILSNWSSKWFSGMGQGALQASAQTQALTGFSGFVQNTVSGVTDTVGVMSGQLGESMLNQLGLQATQMLGQAGHLLKAAQGGGFNPMQLAQMTMAGAHIVQDLVDQEGGSQRAGGRNHSSVAANNDHTGEVRYCVDESATAPVTRTTYVDYVTGLEFENPITGQASVTVVIDASHTTAQDVRECVLSGNTNNNASSDGNVGASGSEGGEGQGLQQIAQMLGTLGALQGFADLFSGQGALAGLQGMAGGNSDSVATGDVAGALPDYSAALAQGQPIVMPVFISEAVPSEWRRDTSTAGRTQLGVWGPTFPLNGIVPTSGANNIRASALAAYRGYLQSEARISANKREPTHKPKFNLDYPHKSRCKIQGTSDVDWESRFGYQSGLAGMASAIMGSGEINFGDGVTDGKHLLTYWKKSSCTMRVCTKDWKILDNTWKEKSIHEDIGPGKSFFGE